MMTHQQCEEAIVNLTQVVAALRSENEALRGPHEALHRDYAALNVQYLSLSQTINSVISERDAFKKKVAELEATNKKLTDQLWGRRSERRLDVSANSPTELWRRSTEPTKGLYGSAWSRSHRGSSGCPSRLRCRQAG